MSLEDIVGELEWAVHEAKGMMNVYGGKITVENLRETSLRELKERGAKRDAKKKPATKKVKATPKAGYKVPTKPCPKCGERIGAKSKSHEACGWQAKPGTACVEAMNVTERMLAKNPKVLVQRIVGVLRRKGLDLDGPTILAVRKKWEGANNNGNAKPKPKG
jgi:hypothetical protein